MCVCTVTDNDHSEPCSLPPHEHHNDLKRLPMLYMETNNRLWQHSSLLLYASLSRNVVLYALCRDKLDFFY